MAACFRWSLRGNGGKQVKVRFEPETSSKRVSGVSAFGSSWSTESKSKNMKPSKSSKGKAISNEHEVGTSSLNTTMASSSNCRRSLRIASRLKPTQVGSIAHSARGLKSVEQLSSNPTGKATVPTVPPRYNLRKEAQKSQDSTKATQKTAVPEKPVKKTNQPCSDIPAYHIKLDESKSKIMNANKSSKGKSNSNPHEAGTSSSKAPMTWGSNCRRSQCSTSGSKPSQVGSIPHSSHPVEGSKSVVQLSSNPSGKTTVPKVPPPSNLKKQAEKSQDSAKVSQKIRLSEKPKVTDQPDSEPVYHIRLDGGDEEHEQFGEKCVLCDKDLSCSPNGVDNRSGRDDEYKYRVKFIPQMLPAVDILPCGHGIHTDCSKYAMSVESNIPSCVLCMSMMT